jgi:ribosomal protein S12 methylthiotransferase accessory factor
MQQIDRRKAYKTTAPFSTINHIRTLLASVDFFTIEMAHNCYTLPGVNCCSVLIGDNDLVDFHIGTNGKGLTTRYALASAYGEFMERLQNDFLIRPHKIFATKKHSATVPTTNGFYERLEQEDLFLDFLYGPDEVYLDVDYLVEDCSDVLATMLSIMIKIH